MEETSEELITNLRSLIAKPKKKEEDRAIKIGKMIIELYHVNKVSDKEILTKIKKIMSKEQSRFGKMIIELYHANKISDKEILVKVKSIMSEQTKLDKGYKTVFLV